MNGLLLGGLEKYKKDKEIVKAAIAENAYSITYADENLRSLNEVLAEVVKEDPILLDYALYNAEHTDGDKDLLARVL